MARRFGGPTFIQRSRQVAPGQKAIYHNVTGAGQSRVVREFIDLDASDVEAIQQRLAMRVRAHVRGASQRAR